MELFHERVATMMHYNRRPGGDGAEQTIRGDRLADSLGNFLPRRANL